MVLVRAGRRIEQKGAKDAARGAATKAMKSSRQDPEQEETEGTEDPCCFACLRSLRCLLFKKSEVPFALIPGQRQGLAQSARRWQLGWISAFMASLRFTNLIPADTFDELPLRL